MGREEDGACEKPSEVKVVEKGMSGKMVLRRNEPPLDEAKRELL